jgi:capsular polysaccharide biosynthesis protein
MPIEKGVIVYDAILPSRLSRDMLVHPEAVNFIRKHLVPPDAAPKKGKRIYLSRGKKTSGARALINEKMLAQRMKRAGFEFVDCGTLTISQQRKLFRDAEIIAGPAGAAMANMVFAPTNAKLLQFAARGAAGNAFSSICSSVGQRSFVCLGEAWQRANSPNWINSEYDFRIDPKDMDIAIDLVLATST